MTAFSLPRIQAANPPVSADNGKELIADSTPDGSSFQQVLAQQAQKAKPEASAAKPAVQNKPAAQSKPVETAKNTDGAQQVETEPAENAKPDTKTAKPDADALALLSLPAKDDAAINKEEAGAVTAEQLPGLFALPLTGLMATPAQSRTPATDAAALAPDAADVLTQRGARPQFNADFAAEKDLAHGQKADTSTAALAANALKLAPAAGDEHAQQPDFAKLLADREPLPAMPVAPAAMPNAVQAAAANTNLIAPPLGSKGWDQAISQKVVWMVGGMEQSATLTLNPPDLGPLQVVIHVHNDLADTTFVSDNPEVRQALQDSIGTLRGMLGNAGIQLGDTNISAGHQAQQQFQQASRQASANSGQQQNGRALPVDTPAVRAYGGNGLVDTFA